MNPSETLLSQLPLVEFDPDKRAIIEPSEHIQRQDVPEHGVICFFEEEIRKAVAEFNAKVIYTFRSEMGEHPVYEIEFEGQRLAFLHSAVGAPLASGLLEETIALGVSRFVAIGGCGVLDKAITVGKIILPMAAVRDEGTSYHYLPPSREVAVEADVLAVLASVLEDERLPYIKTKTWTTDAFYRETVARAAKRVSEGCLVVEMEMAAFLSVAKFRNVKFGQYLYGGDVVLSEGWDHRAWNSRKDIRESLFWLAAKACLKLA
jgi:uridine phosphorylase